MLVLFYLLLQDIFPKLLSNNFTTKGLFSLDTLGIFSFEQFQPITSVPEFTSHYYQLLTFFKMLAFVQSRRKLFFYGFSLKIDAKFSGLMKAPQKLSLKLFAEFS